MIIIGANGQYSDQIGRALDCISEINAKRDDWETSRHYNPQGELIGAQIRTHRKSEMEAEIAAILSHVKLSPYLNHTLGWRTGYRYTGSEAGREDSVLVRQILAAAASGLLDRIQKCACGSWFHRRVEGQKFHSAKCRERAFKSTPEWKEYRREKAREYYSLHKNKNVK